VSAISTAGTVDTATLGAVSCTITNLASGAGALISIQCATVTNGNVTNFATVTTFDADFNSTNNSSSLATPVLPDSDLGLNGSVTNAVLVGSNLVYSLLVTNRGPSIATNLVVTDVLPAGVTYVTAGVSQGSFGQTSGVVTATLGTINKGASATVSVTIKPNQPGSLTNTPSVSSGVLDPSTGDNSVSLITTVNPIADLRLTQSASPNPVNVSSNLTLTFVISNAGPSTANDVILSNALPATLSYVLAQSTNGSCSEASGVVTCNISSLNSNAITVVAITVQPNASGSITNIGRVTSSAVDFSTNNNSATNVISVSTTPTLNGSVSGANAIFSWPTNALGYGLQYTGQLATNSVWSNLTGAVIINGNYYITNAVTGTNRFFRLAR
jgi:uncharacterized repeat protein (TIGR01451 family)